MDREIISFIVPAYNAEVTLHRTIQSILNQTSDSYRIIIINDGSTDKTEEIGKAYSQKYPGRITYVYQPNRGLGGARNHGIELADTEYISFLDSDDWLMPHYVEHIAAQLEKNPGQKPEIIMTLPQIYDENSKLIADWYDQPLFRELVPEDGAYINPQADSRIYRTDVNQCRKILQMDFVKKVHFRFREKVKWEDVFPHFYLLSNCQICMGIGSVGFYYRKGNSNQITASRGKDRMDLLQVYDDLLTYLQETEQGKAHEDVMRYPVMRIMVSFANEGIRMADLDTRKELVKALYRFFKNVPEAYDKVLFREGKKYCGKSEIRQYRIFLAVIRNRALLPIFYDYIYRDASEQLVKKVFRKLKHNETT